MPEKARQPDGCMLAYPDRSKHHHPELIPARELRARPPSPWLQQLHPPRHALDALGVGNLTRPLNLRITRYLSRWVVWVASGGHHILILNFLVMFPCVGQDCHTWAAEALELKGLGVDKLECLKER
jgi:hypothetical protein